MKTTPESRAEMRKRADDFFMAHGAKTETSFLLDDLDELAAEVERLKASAVEAHLACLELNNDDVKRRRENHRLREALKDADETLARFEWPVGSTCSQTQYLHDQLARKCRARIAPLLEKGGKRG